MFTCHQFRSAYYDKLSLIKRYIELELNSNQILRLVSLDITKTYDASLR